MSKIMRSISGSFAKKFTDSEIGQFYFEHHNELFLGVRNEYVNLYYKSASIAKITSVSRELRCEIASKYLSPDAQPGYQRIAQGELIEQYHTIKNNIELFYSPAEKSAQQKLILNNNKNPAAKWVCVDMEYVKQRHSRQDNAFGRFDVIAVSRRKPYTVALIELKYGSSAIGGSSGVLKHTQDYIRFIETGTFQNHLLPEIISIIASYNSIDPSFPLPICEESDFFKEPAVYFITLNNQNDRARQTMRKYVLNDKGASIHNVLDVTGIDLTATNSKSFTPTFLFSENTGSGIFDILEDESYTKGL